MSIEKLIEKWRWRSKSYKQPAHEEFTYEDGKMISFNRCANDLEAELQAIRALVEAAKAVLPKLAHLVECAYINRTVLWTEKGSINFDHCKCGISNLQAAIKKVEVGDEHQETD